jgi:uncharacterized membrane protein AbrB (regulator of aidB expression)
LQPINPWIGVVVIVLAIVAAAVFTKLGIPLGNIVTSLVAIAVTILTGQQHAEVRQDNARLKTQLALFKPSPTIEEKKVP